MEFRRYRNEHVSVEAQWAGSGRNLVVERVMTMSIDAPQSIGIYLNGLAEPRVIGTQALYNY